MAVAALAVLAGAGVVIYQNARELLPSKAPVATADAAPGSTLAPAKDTAAAPKDEAPSWSHSRLVVAEGGSRPVVVLGRPTGVTLLAQARGSQLGLLAREIFRQAMLLAARDEMGLATRDELLGDGPAEKVKTAADFSWIARNHGPASVKVVGEGGKRTLLEHDLLPSAPVHDLVELAEAAERLSRTELPRIFKSLGLEGKPNETRAEAGLPDGVEAQLDSLGFVGPLAAVRAVHQAIRKDGESPARVGALVRGYAQLGVLNEHLWSPVHKAFKARALLYAARLVARDPKSPWGLWHRAYVEALIGLHKRALDDLAEAAKLAGAAGAPSAPAWTDTLAAYCHFELNRLKAVEGPQAKFATFLRMLALEFPHHSNVALRAAVDVLKLDQECFRADEVMYRVGGVANLHGATVFAPQILTQVVPKTIAALESLPASVREPIERNAGEVAMVDALQDAGRPGQDTGEPSWAVLGSLVRETRFVHVRNRLYFLRYQWSVPVEEFWNEARPLVARHRYQPYLLTMAIATPQADRAFAAAFDDSWLPDVEYTEEPMIAKLGTIAEPKRSRAWTLSQIHMDHLVRDYAQQCEFYNKTHRDMWIHNANEILRRSPDNAYAMSLLVDADWDAIQPKLAAWEKKADDFPPLVGALGRQYSELKQYDRARGYLERYIREAPEEWVFERLAKNYREQGDMTHWLATLEQYLRTGEDHGLHFAQVQVEIADYYMSQEQWEKAQPYAEAAAATWAGWAMLCAVRCYEGMKDWEHAELWVRRVSERYPGTSLREWLNFCKRTGHGDAEAAQALVTQLEPEVAETRTTARLPGLQEGLSAWQEGSTRKAMNILRKVYETNPLHAGCALIALADGQGDLAERDKVLADVCARQRARTPKFVDVLEMFRDAFARGDRETPDAAALDRAVQTIGPALRGNALFYTGWLLKKRGKSTEAEAFLKRSIEMASTNPALKSIAEAALKGEGPGAQKVKPPVEK